jgi:hypothetical protein
LAAVACGAAVAPSPALPGKREREFKLIACDTVVLQAAHSIPIKCTVTVIL